MAGRLSFPKAHARAAACPQCGLAAIRESGRGPGFVGLPACPDGKLGKSAGDAAEFTKEILTIDISG